MKTLLFLHREQLTDLFISLSQAIGKRLNVIHVAFNDKEAQKLKDAGITVFYNYSHITSRLFDTVHASSSLINEIDELFLKNTDGRFNLNSALQSDRGFSLLNYEEALLSAQVHYLSWKSIFEDCHVDFMIHEPCSLFFNHIAAVMCRAQGGMFIWQAMTPPEGDDITYLNVVNDDYTCPEIEQNLKYYLENPDKIETTRCESFLNRFRVNYEVMFANMIMRYNKRKLLYLKYRKVASYYKHKRKFDRLKENIDYWLCKQNPSAEKLKNLHDYTKHGVKFEEPIEGEKYYYYSFHLEPEAVVLYLGDGIYANQVKLIENIAAALPPECYLYVKDHPHELAYRNADDYLRLMNIPNVRLIRSSISGKLLIKNAIGVFSINGTAGFEALMLGKQVYNFGKSYYTYCDRVQHILNIRDLRQILYQNRNVTYTDDLKFLAYVNAYLVSMHVGMVDFFLDRAETYNLDLEQNAKRIADNLVVFTNSFGR